MRHKINNRTIALIKKLNKSFRKLNKLRGGGVDGDEEEDDVTEINSLLEDNQKKTENVITQENKQVNDEKANLMKTIIDKNKEMTEEANQGVVKIKDIKVADADRIFLANSLSKILKISGKVGASIPLLQATTGTLSKLAETYKDYVEIHQIIISLKDFVFFAVRLISLIRITKIIFDATIVETVKTLTEKMSEVISNEAENSGGVNTTSDTQISVSKLGEHKEKINRLITEMTDLQFVPEIEYQILAKLEVIKVLLKPYDTAKTIDTSLYTKKLSAQNLNVDTFLSVVDEMKYSQIPEATQRQVFKISSTPINGDLEKYRERLTKDPQEPIINVLKDMKNDGLTIDQIKSVIPPKQNSMFNSARDFAVKTIRSLNTVRLSYKAASVIQTIIKELTLLNSLLLLYNSQFDWIMKSYEQLIQSHLKHDENPQSNTLEKIWEIIRSTKEYKAYLSKDAPPVEAPTTIEEEINMLFDGAIKKIKNIGSARSIKEILKTVVSVGLGVVDSGVSSDGTIDTLKMEKSAEKMKDEFVKTNANAATKVATNPNLETVQKITTTVNEDVSNISAASTQNAKNDRSGYERIKDTFFGPSSAQQNSPTTNKGGRKTKTKMNKNHKRNNKYSRKYKI